MNTEQFVTFLNHYFQDDQLKLIFQDVLSTDDPKKVYLLINQAIISHLSTELEEVLFIQSSIGVVFGLRLSNDGSTTVLKVYSPRIPKTYLDQINHYQALFYSERFLAPKVLSSLFPFGLGYAGFYELIQGIEENAHKPAKRHLNYFHL